MQDLWLYRSLTRIGISNYRAKIMIMAFIGTHIPLIALISFFALRSETSWGAVLATVGVALLATLVGTGLTLFVLNHLLRPVLMTSRSLRAYRTSREILPLPVHFTDEVGTLMADAGQTIDHLERVRDRLEFMDASTGLPNRRRFEFDLARRIGSAPFAAGVITVASHETLAATFDHATAETMFRRLAGRIETSLGGMAAGLYRIDGDKLAFVTERRDGDGAGWTETTVAIRAALEAGTAAERTSQHGLPVLRVGLAACPNDAQDATGLIDLAVAASAIATEAAPVAFHSAAARAAARERFTLEQELAQALKQDQFVLHFQPVVDVSVGRAIGAEALIRWQHPVRGLVPPGQFIPVAEASGLIDPMGLWVMRRACRQLNDWSAAGMDDMTLAINLSARQFLDVSLVDQIREALADSRVAPNRLEIELTESAAMVDHDYTRMVFGRLRDLGVRIAIDDFGTGYASMSYLRKLPFDKLKIDREFVTNVHQTRDAQAICGAVVALARGLGLEVLAEGTETEEEVRHLHASGCHLFQGFYFSKPVPATDFAQAVNGLDLVQKTLRAA